MNEYLKDNLPKPLPRAVRKWIYENHPDFIKYESNRMYQSQKLNYKMYINPQSDFVEYVYNAYQRYIDSQKSLIKKMQKVDDEYKGKVTQSDS